MRKITFTEIGMENYGPYVEPFIVECPDDSLTLITGPNGVGKTISLDALSFTFYGITSKGERGDDVVNNIVGKNCHTWVKFHDSEDNSYIVDRYHKHSKYRNTARITRNGEDKPYKVGHREVTTEIEKLICDRKTFTNTLMFGQKVKDFFTDLPDTDQKAIFWKLLDLLKYSYFRKTAKTELDVTEKSIQKIRNDIEIALGIITNTEEQITEEGEKAQRYELNKKNIIEQYQTNINDINDLISLAEKTLKQIPKIDLAKMRENYFVFKAKLDNVGKDAENIKKEVEQEAYQKVNELTASRNDKLRKITEKYQGLLSKINERAEIANQAFEKDINESNQKTTDLHGKESAIKASMVSNYDRVQELEINDLEVGCECPTCLEAITEKSIKNIQIIIGELKVKSQDYKLELAVIKVASDKIKKQKKDSADKRNELTSGFSVEKLTLHDKEQAENKKADKRLETLKTQLADIANTTVKTRIQDHEVKAQKMISDQSKAKGELDVLEENDRKRIELETKLSEYNTRGETIKNQIVDTQEKDFDESNLNQLKINKHKQLEILEKSNAEIKETDMEINRIKFWMEAYSPRGIPSMLIDQAVPLMNKSMRKYLDLLSNGRYIVTFDTISQTKGGEYRDKFSVNVLDTKTQVNNRKQLSGGQTRLIDIATILTLRDLKTELSEVDFNLFAFDEIFDALDDVNIGAVCGILNSLKADRSLLVISHRHQDELEADNHIQLT